MKKKLLFCALIALFLSAGLFAATSLTQQEQLSDLTLANIEALADEFENGTLGGDSPGPVNKSCHKTGTNEAIGCYANNTGSHCHKSSDCSPQ